MSQYPFSSSLSDLIEFNSQKISNLAQKCGMSEIELCDALSKAFANKYSSEEIIYDDEENTISFSSPFADLYIIGNRDSESSYPYYLNRFAVKSDQNHNLQPLTEEVKKEIYYLLSKKFQFGIPLPMAAISLEITNGGYRKEQYGFSKMKNMLSEMNEFISMEDTVTNGVPAILVTLHRNQKWEIDQTTVQKVDQTSAIPETLTKNVALPLKTLSILNNLICGESSIPDQSTLKKLYTSYEEARNRNQLYQMGNGNVYKFDTGLYNEDGNKIHATIKYSEHEGKMSWVLNWFGVDSVSPKDALEKFAYLGDWNTFLRDLADKALPEKWGFDTNNESDLTILKMYIKYTFYRLQLEDKICISDDQKLAAFNTGLVNYAYEDIYACFVPNSERGASKWKYQCFCIKAERGDGKSRGMGKRLVESFKVLPQPASYFNKKDDLLMDLEKELHPDYQHIIVDNIDRLPLEFISEQARDIKEIRDLVEEIRVAPKHLKYRLYDELREMIDDTDAGHKVFNRMLNRIKDAIDLAKKKVRWNFKTALPCYYPTTNVMSLMLPLALMDDDTANVALVVEKTKSGTYLGQTILKLQDAYIDSRLICRPNSEWLNTEDILSGDQEFDD